MQVKDPRGDSTGLKSTNGQTGKASVGGYLEVAGVDLGNGTAAVALVTLTRTKTTVAGSNTSEQLLAADVSRLSASILNTDGTDTLYLGLGVAAVVGQGVAILPGKVGNVPAASIAGVVNGIWNGTPSGGAQILASTA